LKGIICPIRASHEFDYDLKTKIRDAHIARLYDYELTLIAIDLGNSRMLLNLNVCQTIYCLYVD